MLSPTIGRRRALALLLMIATSFLSFALASVPAHASTPTAFSVTSYGATGTGQEDDTAAIRRAVSAAASARAPIHFPAGTYKISETIYLSNGLTGVQLDPAATIVQYGNASVFRRAGTFHTRRALLAPAARFATSVRVADTSGLAPGKWLFLAGDDAVQVNKGWKAGSLRKITAISGQTVTFDIPLHRKLSVAPAAWDVRLAPPVAITGGHIRFATPLQAFEPLVQFNAVERPILSGTELFDCGGSGVRLTSTVGGEVDVYVHDCVDDNRGVRFKSGQHYGYGVEVAGATRDLVVKGRAHDVRHAFTTSGAYGQADKRLRLYGEPERVTVTMDVSNTTSTGLDTHEVGYLISFVDCVVRDAGRYLREGSTDQNEGGFGVFIRSRGTSVIGGSIERSATAAIYVTPTISSTIARHRFDDAVLRGTRIEDAAGSRAVSIKHAARVDQLVIRGANRYGVQVDAGVTGVQIGSLDVQLTGAQWVPVAWG